MADMNDFNAQIIDEFRQNGGKLGGGFAGVPMLLLTTTGAKSGKERTAPLVYLRDGDRAVIFGSKAGADTNPDWFHNLRANPRVRVEQGTETYEADAVITEGAERDRLFDLQKQALPPLRSTRRRPTGSSP